jgi:hypothetical protein
MAEIASADANEPANAVEAEAWASCLLGTLHARALPDEDVEAMFLPGFIDALEALRTPAALATLRALGAVIAPDHGRRARAAADRLAGEGVAEPPWTGDLGQAWPTAAALLHEAAFDDGVSVLVEFSGPGIETHTLGIYVDHNLGGLVKDVFLAEPLIEVRRRFERPGADRLGIGIRELDLAESRARVTAALYMLDHTYDPPVSEDVRRMRAFVDSRMRLLPEGFAFPDEVNVPSAEEREALLEDFLGSTEGRRWRDDEDAEDIACLAVDFGSDYNHGDPLRWSPVVVEIFMTSWLARKVGREPTFFERVADVLRDWVAYAGRRRGVPASLVHEAVAAVDECRDEMLEAVADPSTWGPAKTFELAARGAGVDLSDPDEIERFLERYNRGLAA